jgi:uncharacterized membrane protein
MTAPGGPKSTWGDLSPWEKAAQWRDKAPHISEKLMALAEEHMKHEMELERVREKHNQRMEIRRWWTQIAILALALCNVVIVAILAPHLIGTGSVVPGLAIFGATSAGLTIGAYGVGRWRGRKNSGQSAASDLVRDRGP